MEPDAAPSTKGIIVQILCSLVACAAILSPGMNMGYSAFALKGMRSSLNLTTDQETWIASLSNLVTPIGCLLSGPILERYGRKCTLLLVAVPCSIGWFLMAIQPTLSRIYIGRILTGLATGLASTPGSVYAAECALSTLRGYLMSGSTVFISLGILVVNVLGLLYKDNWQIVAGIGGLVSLLVAALTLVFLPESPVWLLSKGYESKAAAALKTLRGTSRIELVQKELETLMSNKRKAQSVGEGEGVWRGLSRPEAYKPLLILNVFFLFQQLTGIYVAVSYTLDFVKASGVTQDIGFIAVMLGALRLLVIFVGTCCSKTLGRRFTAIVSGVGMTPCLLLLAYDTYSSQSHAQPVHNNLPLFSSNSSNLSSYSLLNTSLSTTLSPLVNSSLASLGPLVNSTLPAAGAVSGQTSWVPVAAIVLYIVFSTFGFLIIPWSLLGEIYPAKSREVACGITACLAYLFNFAIVKYYPYMSRSIGTYGVFAFFGVMAFIGTLFVIVFLPETQGKTLAEIEQYFIGSHPAHSRPEEEESLNGGPNHSRHRKTPIVKPVNPS